MPAIVSDLQSAAPSAIIELFELQLISGLHGASDMYRFHAGVNAKNNGNLIWAGSEYLAFPVEADGFEYSGSGQLPRPVIRVSNALGTITALLLALPNGLEGAKITRIRTLARYLDAVNFTGNVNPFGTPDPTAEMPREIYFIDRKSAETREVVEFELSTAFDLQGVRLPKRQCISSVCQWIYKSVECGYDPTSAAALPLRQHYKDFGYAEGRMVNGPGGTFNPSYYLSLYTDVAAAGYNTSNAIQHYRNYGIWEGRSANGGGPFDAAFYLATYGDLKSIVYFDENDNGVQNVGLDKCGKQLSSCKARFGQTAQLPFGSFPGVGSFFT